MLRERSESERVRMQAQRTIDGFVVDQACAKGWWLVLKPPTVALAASDVFDLKLIVMLKRAEVRDVYISICCWFDC